jgi:hypothetical protein
MEHWMYLIFQGGYARVVEEHDNWSVAHEMTGETGRLFAVAREMRDVLRVADDALDFAQAQVDSDKDADKLRAWRKQIQGVLSKTEGGE